MKVKNLNNSSIKTKSIIKSTFVKLIKEHGELNKITVSELVKKADINRSTFYNHYDSIYDVAHDYELQTIELICSEDLKLYCKKDIKDYFANIITCLKENEETYKLLLSANETLFFLEKLKKIAGQKIYDALKNEKNDKYLKLSVSFFINGTLTEILKYFRNESNYTLDELLLNMENWFEKLFG